MELGGDALGELMAQPWEGNVRELKHVVERAVLHSSGRRVTRADVRMALPGGMAPRRAINGATFARRRLEELLVANDWDTAKVAGALGVHRATVYRQMKRLGLEGAPAPLETLVLPDSRVGTPTVRSS